MRVMVLGADGYIGWALAQRLAQRGHVVFGGDSALRRRWVAKVGSDSVVDIPTYPKRKELFREHFGEEHAIDIVECRAHNYVRVAMERFEPEAVVMLAQQPSAPYSMRSVYEALETIDTNEIGLMSVLWAMREVAFQAHLVMIGTSGEYGTPPVDIPEPPFEMQVCYSDGATSAPFRPAHFPRCPASFYHATKVASTHMIERACAWWGLRATDVQQGPVYGLDFAGRPDDERMRTRFDVDDYFGTVINRFCAQAVLGIPLTVYGTGGQKRSFLPLDDSLQCLEIILGSPPKPGEYRCLNQYDAIYSVGDLAEAVVAVARAMGLEASVGRLDNPRCELESHHYAIERYWLDEHGYEPRGDLTGQVRDAVETLVRNRDRLESLRGAILPRTRWA